MITGMMKAANLYKPGDLRVEDVHVPEFGPNDVLVKVLYCGICGSDIPRILTTGTYHFPTIPGHEFSGVVAEMGQNVQKVNIGDRVSIIPLIPCRKCKYCEIGQYAQCENYSFLGSREDGGFAQYVRVPQGNLVKVPAEVSDKSAAMLEPITVAMHAVKNMGVEFGDNVAVFGLGAIGNFVAQWAKSCGANHVFAIDIDPEKVSLAKKVGLKDSICITEVNVNKFIMKETNGLGVDVAFEASGSEIAFAQAVSLVRNFGKLGVIGRPGKDIILKNETFEKILRGQITIKGSWSFEFSNFPHHAWLQSVQAIKNKIIIVEPLVTNIFSLEHIHQGIKILSEKKVFANKILIKP